jgi:hypothetical protein
VVTWAADVLESEYIDKPPLHITDIWLCRDARSDAMNIATDGGMLVQVRR